jgi:Sigma-70 region 2
MLTRSTALWRIWQNIVPLTRITPVGNTPSFARNGATGLDHSGNDLTTFERFYWQHERHIIGYLCRMVGDDQAAHDLSQETFLRAWRHFAALRQHSAPRAWLFRVATNLALSFLRRRAARPVLPLDEDMLGILLAAVSYQPDGASKALWGLSGTQGTNGSSSTLIVMSAP